MNRLGTGLIVMGHLLSYLGCRVKGGHAPRDGRFKSYCAFCGRFQGTIPG